MTCWREPVSHIVCESRPTTDRRTYAALCGSRAPGGRFEVFYRRWTGPGELPPFGPHIKRHPGMVIEYRDPATSGLFTLDEARERMHELAERVIDIEFPGYEARPTPAPPTPVKELSGSNPRLKAWIMQHHEGHFEVRCFHHEVIAATQDGSYVEWDWVRVRTDFACFAIELAEAEVAAQEELEDLGRSFTE